MATPRLHKLSKEVGLVLISSSLFLAGCRRHLDDDKKDDDATAGQQTSSGWHGGGGHGVYTPFMGRGDAGVSRAGPAAGSARGGFGATGHAASAGG
jgi:hypothetical protein